MDIHVPSQVSYSVCFFSRYEEVSLTVSSREIPPINNWTHFSLSLYVVVYPRILTRPVVFSLHVPVVLTLYEQHKLLVVPPLPPTPLPLFPLPLSFTPRSPLIYRLRSPTTLPSSHPLKRVSLYPLTKSCYRNRWYTLHLTSIVPVFVLFVNFRKRNEAHILLQSNPVLLSSPSLFYVILRPISNFPFYCPN